MCHAICVQERHDVLGKERQSEFDRASAAEVARTGMEVQLTAHQERVANLTTQLQESGVQIQVNTLFLAHCRIGNVQHWILFCATESRAWGSAGHCESRANIWVHKSPMHTAHECTSQFIDLVQLDGCTT